MGQLSKLTHYRELAALRNHERRPSGDAFFVDRGIKSPGQVVANNVQSFSQRERERASERVRRSSFKWCAAFDSTYNPETVFGPDHSATERMKLVFRARLHTPVQENHAQGSWLGGELPKRDDGGENNNMTRTKILGLFAI